jgi:glycosyltransferase involved in cell wall biosynthesis
LSEDAITERGGEVNLCTPPLTGGLRTFHHCKRSLPGVPLISILTVVRNAQLDLKETIESVARQTYPNIEYIVVDGDSTDGTVNVLRQFESVIDFWLSERDNGIYDAMNKGVSLCRGEYVSIIGAGDWYFDDAVSAIVETLVKSPCDVVYGDLRIIDRETQLSTIRRKDHTRLRQGIGMVGHATMFVRKSLLVSKKFDDSYRIAADHKLYLALRHEGRSFVHCGRIVCCGLSDGVSYAFLSRIEDFKIRTEYFGVAFAAWRLAIDAVVYGFAAGRRRALQALLSPEHYAALRAWRISRNGGEHLPNE